jgi:threonine/homoserine/homoserine lactone efflux protein
VDHIGILIFVTWSAYFSFLTCVITLVVIPGPDFATTVRNTLRFGRVRGAWCAGGVTTANLLQGVVVCVGVGRFIVRMAPVLEWVKWVGVLYLVYLGLRSIYAAMRARCDPIDIDNVSSSTQLLAGYREGFLTNITNPKVLTFYLAVLPQWIPPGGGTRVLLLLVLSHSILLLLYLWTTVLLIERVRPWLTHRRSRRVLDGATGAALLGFGLRLASGKL